MEGRYTDLYLQRAGADAPKFTPADMKAIGSPSRLRRPLNIYNPAYVRAADNPAGFVDNGSTTRTALPAHDEHLAHRWPRGPLLGPPS